jgi:hypothetical protein
MPHLLAMRFASASRTPAKHVAENGFGLAPAIDVRVVEERVARFVGGDDGRVTSGAAFGGDVLRSAAPARRQQPYASTLGCSELAESNGLHGLFRPQPAQAASGTKGFFPPGNVVGYSCCLPPGR